ncbi:MULTISPECIES: hypothetical protein [Streptomycetaceae]|uniref:Uncharacterized protein n=1 Tax=Streptantibioticus cattleyicolor (strain ATCC 35852 / DSM 46488 / JCM 4925 / NBRC 14057 / NRRL 8057) TaxID=1003195 RepID=F8JY72_STREN|nr:MULTISPECIES: hypothetical protein [Streptomycetaceae]AEW94651.1 hypothetical protein SCATT_22800 [Streptantibioticus cattleyicolor NRRL 8057 = DSM 46488]MYS59289.1 hypothetical protein [Streptomyces sp. SID5468]CCB75007.1 putative Predicted protein [Streptantibioticus cattleyicolor NRRL 8057 = DSM 46488]
MTPSPTAAERAALRVAQAAALTPAASYDLVSSVVFALGSAQLLQCPESVAEARAQAPLTVYRAEYDGIPLGLYTTPEAARAHCEAYGRREQPRAVLDWIADEEDQESPHEMVAQVGDEETLTGYVVTPLPVATAFADGDE